MQRRHPASTARFGSSVRYKKREKGANSVIRLTWRPRVDDAHEAMALVVLRREDDAVDLGSVL